MFQYNIGNVTKKKAQKIVNAQSWQDVLTATLHWYLGEYFYNMLGLNSSLQARNRHIVIKVAQKLLMLEYHINY